MRADVTGNTNTNPAGERYIEAATALENGSGTVEPLGLNNLGTGGGDWFYDESTGAGQRGVLGGTGLNNIGLLVRTWGKITYVGADDFYIEDGSGADDGSGHPGVRVLGRPPVDPGADPVGKWVRVEGVSSCYKTETGLHRLIRGTDLRFWSVRQVGTEVEIAYGQGAHFPQYAVLHLNDSYFRMVYGEQSTWGTSVILFPPFWSGGYQQGVGITATWETDVSDLVISFSGTKLGLTVQGKVRLSPPRDNSMRALVTVQVSGDVPLDERPDPEAFKPVMLSSMHVSETQWDAQSAYVGTQSHPIPESGIFANAPLPVSVFGLNGGTSAWKTNAPTVDIALDEAMRVMGYVSFDTDPNHDNVGLWAGADEIVRSYQYTITVKP